MDDLISRSALLNTIYGDKRPEVYDGQDIANWQMKCIECAPAVDAEPVRHGKWEMCRKTLKTGFATLTGTYPTCSLCGHVEFGVDKSTPYCPGCGAKMDGGD